MDKDDWRLMGQERYFKREKLYHTKYKFIEPNDHDHCSFCFDKFYSENQTGYCTQDYYNWICETCYNDFKEDFEWIVVEEDSVNPTS